MTLRRLLDILIPRFLTEDLAVEMMLCDHCDDEHLTPVCCMESIEPGEVFDGIITMRCLNLFGWALFARQVGDVRPFVNPHDASAA